MNWQNKVGNQSAPSIDMTEGQSPVDYLARAGQMFDNAGQCFAGVYQHKMMEQMQQQGAGKA